MYLFAYAGVFLFSNQSMKWTNDHTTMFVREILAQAPWEKKHGSTERGEVWSNIAKTLNSMENPKFMVSQRSVRDRYNVMEKNHKKKTREEERESGTSPEVTEVDEAMDEIIGQFEECDREHEKQSEDKRQKAEEDVKKADEMRKRSLETYKDTQKRSEEQPLQKRKRASGSDTMSFLKEKTEMENKIKEEERALRREEMEKQAELQKEELQLKRLELEEKRKQNEAMHQSSLMQQQQMHLMMQQQQQQSALIMSFLEKVHTTK